MSNSHLPPAIQPLSRIPNLQVSAQLRTWVAALHRIRALLLRCGSGPIGFWYALRLATRSFVGHTKTLLCKKHWGILLGPRYETLSTGCLVRNERTNARSVGIQELTSRYPWANTVELEMFLEGFDKGEQFALGRLDKPAQVFCESSVSVHGISAVATSSFFLKGWGPQFCRPPKRAEQAPIPLRGEGVCNPFPRCTVCASLSCVNGPTVLEVCPQVP
jgi:hypothetical protein